MPTLYFDTETGSPRSLHEHGAWAYAACSDTRVWCLCFAVDDGKVQSWTSGDQVPDVFTAIAADSTGWDVVAHGIEFDRAIYEHILVARHGFPPLPLDIQHCSMSLALANAYPAELARLCSALGIVYQKDREGALLMRQMALPRKNRKGEKGIHWVFDAEKLARLITYCAQDIQCCRAVWTHPRLVHLTAPERQLQIIDAAINRRGVHFDRRFVECARALSIRERTALNNKLSELTDGAVTHVDETKRLLKYINKHGHNLISINRRSIATALAASPDEATRLVLEIRREGARASTRKFRRILAWGNDDDRLRGTMRFHGGAPGRWSGRGPQLQNLKRNDLNVPPNAIDAVLAGDREALAKHGPPLEVIGCISKAVLDAAPGHRLMKCDLSSIESRVLAGFAKETWKVTAYREFDRTGDTQLEPYCVVARKMLRKNDLLVEITAAERQIGKGGDLAGGFGGSVGAWRRLVPKDERSDDEIYADIRAWRQAHPKTVQFWRTLAAAARLAIRTGGEHKAGPITASYRNETLYLTLPSGRAIAYPQARLIPSKFEDAPPDILFKDNSRGAWTDRRAWFGTLVENVVQGAARDILAAAIVRLEMQGIPVVLSVHDEVVIEVPLDSPLTEEAFLALVLTPPPWAAELPLAGKVSSGTCYLTPPDGSRPSISDIVPDNDDDEPYEDDLADWLPSVDLPKASADKLEREDAASYVAGLQADVAPLWELTTQPLTDDHKISCPFHNDPQPSCQLYADHFYCFGCGACGNRIDWLVQAEGLTESEALNVIADWTGNGSSVPAADRGEKIEYALSHWQEAVPIAGTIAERYLSETRGVDVGRLPANISDSLRFHPNCVFGPERHPCLLALMRDAIDDTPIGIQRIGLARGDGRIIKLKRMALGCMGAVKLWPANGQLTVGEGLETVLSACTRLSYGGASLIPAWALISSVKLAALPVLPEVQRITVLVDHDLNGQGQAAGDRLECTWRAASRTVLQLLPDNPGDDFNDIVLRGRL
jgi:CHC2 zinc finger/Toprim domain